jgi:hypothetical protein
MNEHLITILCVKDLGRLIRDREISLGEIVHAVLERIRVL